MILRQFEIKLEAHFDVDRFRRDVAALSENTDYLSDDDLTSLVLQYVTVTVEKEQF